MRVDARRATAAYLTYKIHLTPLIIFCTLTLVNRMIRFTLKPTEPTKLDVDVLILYTFEDEVASFPLGSDKVQALYKESLSRESFEGKSGQTLTVYTKGLIGAYKVMMVGMGKKEKTSVADIQNTIASSIRKVRDMHPSKIAIHPHISWNADHTSEILIQAIVEAVSLSTYQFLNYKGDEEKKIRNIEEVLISVSPQKIASGEKGKTMGITASKATSFARDLVNEPAAITTPAFLASIAKEIAKASKGAVKVEILEKDDAKKLGMHSFLGVAQGSDEAPKLIVLSYKSAKPKKKIALIGKGITFDTGGLSLKPAEHMETMKLDMAGAAAVLAVFKVIFELKIDADVVGIIAACENMPSGKALKPGDILRAMSGKTIEVLNTDAEGRLTLADAISYAIIEEKANVMIDLATLTGACMVALGNDIAGLWGNNEELLTELETSAQESGEKVWTMPLEKSYIPLIKSHIADVKNIQTGRYGGAITAALFLSEFAQKTPWAHLDIAGPAFSEKDAPMTPLGGTGFGVRLLLHYIQGV